MDESAGEPDKTFRLEPPSEPQDDIASAGQSDEPLEVVAHVARRTFTTLDPKPGGSPSHVTAWTVKYISNHFAEPVKLDDLARGAQLSKYHFLRKFRMEVGITPGAYLKRYRIVQAMDQLTREIRQSINVLSFTTNSITILTADTNGAAGPTVTYLFSPSAKKMLRTSSDGTSAALLDNCNLLSFQLFTRCPSNGAFGIFPVAVNNWSNTVKVLQLTWKTSILQPSGIANSENIQTARIVLRKQQDS